MLRLLHQPRGDGQPLLDLTDDAARTALLGPLPAGLLWLDITNQDQHDIDLLAQVFKLHPLALEDCLQFDQRPKLEEYGGETPYLFIVTHNCAVVDVAPPGGDSSDEGSMLVPRYLRAHGRTGSCAIQVLEVHAFLSPSFLITVHSEPSRAIDTVLSRVRLDPSLLCRGTDFVYYLSADLLCDSNFPVIESLGDLLDELEGVILHDPQRRDLNHIHSLRKAMVSLRRLLSPQRDVMGALFRHGGSVCIGEKNAPYFRDIYDHLNRIYESLESGRDLLASCIDAYLSTIGQRTNEIMKQLTLMSSILMPMTFLSGFFGMNFQQLPFGSSTLFWVAMAIMFLALPTAMLLLVRSKGWLR
jgi:magnesium transporter